MGVFLNGVEGKFGTEYVGSLFGHDRVIAALTKAGGLKFYVDRDTVFFAGKAKRPNKHGKEFWVGRYGQSDRFAEDGTLFFVHPQDPSQNSPLGALLVQVESQEKGSAAPFEAAPAPAQAAAQRPKYQGSGNANQAKTEYQPKSTYRRQPSK
jgi:hypothetical protein